MEDIGIRDSNPDDSDDIRHVARASWHAAKDDVLGAEAIDEFVDEYYADEMIEAAIERPDTFFFVAVEDSTVVGFTAAAPTEDVETTYSLRSIYVHPDDWGRGVGSRLLSRLETAIRSNGGDRIQLHVVVENEVGIAFYESKGFERVGEFYNETHGVDMYGYRKDL